MDSMFSKIMQVIWLIILLLGLLLSLLARTASAQGGCQAGRLPVLTDQVLQGPIELAPAVPEQFNLQPQGVYYEQQATIYYQGQRVLVSAPCVDDVLVITNLSTGQEWRHDYRSPDGQKILTVTSPLEITSIFAPFFPGEHVLKIFYWDITPKYRSASGIWLWQEAGQPAVVTPGPPEPTPTETPTPFPTHTSTPSPTWTPTATPILLPPAPSSAEPGREIPGWPLLPLVLGGVSLLGGSVALLLWMFSTNRQGIPGNLHIHDLEDAQFLGTVNLDHFKAVTIGSDERCTIPLPADPTIPKRAVRIVPGSEQGRGPEASIQTLDDQGKVLTERPLFEGEELILGRYQITYSNPLAEPPTILDGSAWTEGGLTDVY